MGYIRLIRACYLQHSGFVLIPASPTVRLRDVLLRVQRPPELRREVAPRALRRRACTWDPPVPQALVGSFPHFSRTRPRPRASVLGFAVLVQCLVHSCMVQQPSFRVPLWVRLPWGAGSQFHVLVCPVFRHCTDLRMCSTSLASASYVGHFLRSLSLLAPLSMCSAILFDRVLWAAERSGMGAPPLRGNWFSGMPLAERLYDDWSPRLRPCARRCSRLCLPHLVARPCRRRDAGSHTAELAERATFRGTPAYPAGALARAPRRFFVTPVRYAGRAGSAHSAVGKWRLPFTSCCRCGCRAPPRTELRRCGSLA